MSGLAKTTTEQPQLYASRALAPFTTDDLTIGPGAQRRVLDVTLAKRLGFERPSNIRNLIKRNREEIEGFGILLQAEANSRPTVRGRPSCGYLLNRQQAILVPVFVKTSNAAKVRKQVIQVFDAAAQIDPIALFDDSAPDDAVVRRGELKELIAGFGCRLAEIDVDLQRVEAQARAWEDRPKKLPAAAEGGKAHDPIGTFLSECVVERKGSRVSSSALYAAYGRWALLRGVEPPSTKAFSTDLSARQMRRMKSDGIWWLDIATLVSSNGSAPRSQIGMLYGGKAIAAFLGVALSTLGHLRSKGGMPIFKVGSRLCASAGALQAWLTAKAVGDNRPGRALAAATVEV